MIWGKKKPRFDWAFIDIQISYALFGPKSAIAGKSIFLSPNEVKMHFTMCNRNVLPGLLIIWYSTPS